MSTVRRTCLAPLALLALVLGSLTSAACAAPSPPVDAPKTSALPPASRPVVRDAEGTPPAEPATRAEREDAALAVLSGRVSLPSETGQAWDWRVARAKVDGADGTSLEEARKRYGIAESELEACYRRLAATSRKGEAKAKVRYDGKGVPTRVEWASGALSPEIYACAADTFLAIPLSPTGKAATVTVVLTLDDR